MGKQPKYVSKLLEGYANGAIQPGTVGTAEVRHDDWCSIWRGKACDCEPDIEVIWRKAG